MSISMPQSVLMAHALKRISLATCTPETQQFSFLAREPRVSSRGRAGGSTQVDDTTLTVQYCHSFKTDSAEQVR